MFKRFAVVVLLLLAGPAWADPALWVARGPRANVYILGSVHMLRPGVTWESPAIRRAFDEARECWFEAVLPDDPAAMQTMMISMGLDPAHKLTDLLPPNRRAQFEELAASTGMGFVPSREDDAVQLRRLPQEPAGHDARQAVGVG